MVLRHSRQGHEAPHHATVLEFVPDGVGVVWASLLKEPLEVVRRRPHRASTAARGARDAPQARATCFLAMILITMGHGGGP
jgi:hypothetical protein